MPHQCVRCNEFYADGADEILRGCSCGGRLFFFVKQAKLEAAKAEVDELKKSAAIRFLFKGKMQKAVIRTQKKDLRSMGDQGE